MILISLSIWSTAMDGRLTVSSGLENCTLVLCYCTLVQAFEQRIDTEGFVKKTGRSGGEHLLPDRFVGLTGNKHDWNVQIRVIEFLLKLDSTHFRQIYVQD
jgi:hypothetical protein